jgi:hypothetical protein
MVIKKEVIEDTPKDMELENLMQQFNPDNHNKHLPNHCNSQTYDEIQRDDRGRKMGVERVECSMFDV